MTGKVLCNRHPTAVGWLKFLDRENPLRSGYLDGVFCDCSNLTGSLRCCLLHWQPLDRLPSVRTIECVRARPRRKPSNTIGNQLRRQGPIDDSIFFLQQRRHRGLTMVLRTGNQCPGFQLGNGLHEQSPAEFSQPGRQTSGCILRSDGNSPCSKMAPVSMPSSIIIVVMPVSASPLMMAHWIGPAPRYFGNNDPCTLMQPLAEASENAGGRMRPNAVTTMKSGFQSDNAVRKSRVLHFYRMQHRDFFALATSFIGDGVTTWPRPLGDPAA